MASDAEMERLRYQHAWEQHRRRDNLGCIVIALVSALPTYATHRYLVVNTQLVHRPSPFPGVPTYFFTVIGVFIASLLLGLAVGTAVVEVGLRRFRCPRCGKQFQPNRFDRPSCQHGGLPYGAEPGPDAE